MRHATKLAVAALAALLLAAPAGRAADPVTYDVSIPPTGIDELDAAAADVSLLRSLRTAAPVGPAALVARGYADAERLIDAMHSLGYYDAGVTVRIAGEQVAAPGLVERLEALPEATIVPVELVLEPGRLFPLGRVQLLGDVPAAARATFTLAPGQPARAADILAARDALRSALRDAGHALAEVSAPDAVLDPAAGVIDVSFSVRAGPRVAIGDIAFGGLKGLDPAFVRRRLKLRTGEKFNPARLEAARRDLAAVPAVAGVAIEEGTTLDGEGRLPVVVRVRERKPRVIDLAAGWSTDEGGQVSAAWTHRNLFGGAEQLTLGAAATQLGGSAGRAPGYNLDALLVLPEVPGRDQSLAVNLNAQRAYLRAYDRTAVRAAVTLRQVLTRHWTATVGAALQQARITQEGEVANYLLVQAPLGLIYDSTNSKLDPTRGARAGLLATPSVNMTRHAGMFAVVQASASTYLDLGRYFGKREGRTVLAVRGLVGTILGGSVGDLPPDQRFYAGGSATIRGYRFQSVGPSFASGRPRGGTAIDAASVELRQRIGDSWGMAAFVDAGQVSAAGTPFTGDLRVGAGLGVRYYTGIGPIRADIAVPLTGQRKTDAVQFYIGIGHAF
ncbi:MAG: BamA/TamA family outer membrane protein [Acetobacteraceae bacterium]|nr:BamA/TamA family outer membrane protein [Acetobacteraceae bacterium]